MTESQRKFLTGYLGECWHNISGGISEDMMSLKCGVCGKWLHILDIELYCQRTFTEPKDKQDLLEAIIQKEGGVYGTFEPFWLSDTSYNTFVVWLIQLSPEETAELICKWKGVS